MSDNTIQPRRAFLIGLREDGSPTCHPMVAVESEGEIAFNTYRKSTKIRNFQRDPRAAVVLLENWRVAPSTAQLLTGSLLEVESNRAATPAAPPPAEAGGIPVSRGAAERARKRVSEGKRVLLRLRQDGPRGT
jgi:hypothetical protein